MKNKNILGLFIFFIVTIAIIVWLVPKDDLHAQKTTTAHTPNKEQINNSIIKQNTTHFQTNFNGNIPVNTSQTLQEFKPQLEWRDKTISINDKTIHYKFGEGNPIEVALSPEQYLANGEIDGIPYVTKEAEQQLRNFLAEKNLAELLNKCVHFLNKKMQQLNSNIPQNQLPVILNNDDVDIENYLIIDKQTGRKMINPDIDSRMNDFFNTLNNPLNQSPLAMECFGLTRMEDFNQIQKQFHDLGITYSHTAIQSSTQ